MKDISFYISMAAAGLVAVLFIALGAHAAPVDNNSQGVIFNDLSTSITESFVYDADAGNLQKPRWLVDLVRRDVA